MLLLFKYAANFLTVSVFHSSSVAWTYVERSFRLIFKTCTMQRERDGTVIATIQYEHQYVAQYNRIKHNTSEFIRIHYRKMDDEKFHGDATYLDDNCLKILNDWKCFSFFKMLTSFCSLCKTLQSIKLSPFFYTHNYKKWSLYYKREWKIYSER